MHFDTTTLNIARLVNYRIQWEKFKVSKNSVSTACMLYNSTFLVHSVQINVSKFNCPSSLQVYDVMNVMFPGTVTYQHFTIRLTSHTVFYSSWLAYFTAKPHKAAGQENGEN